MNQITQFLISYGGLILFALNFAEQFGLPLPAEPWLVVAGALAASGKFDLIAGIAWSAAGCVAADGIWYFLGYRGRSHMLRVFPHLKTVQAKLNRDMSAEIVLHGTRMLTLAKFIPFGQVVLMRAGAMEVGRLRFLLVDALTSVIYTAMYAALGFAFHNQLEQVVAFVRKLGTFSVVVVVVLGAAYVIFAFFKYRRGQHAPEPGKNEGNTHNEIRMFCLRKRSS
jgi:membrane protein DedA with SNARE-associated domain